MTLLLLAAFGLVFAVPLFFGSWRMALLGLGAQTMIVLALLLARSHGGEAESLTVLVLDLGLIRGLLAPLALGRAAPPAVATGPPIELFPGDLLHWVVAAALVALGAKLGARLFPGEPAHATHAAIASAEVFLGFCVVAHQRTVLGQAIGMLTIENGAVLFEGLLGSGWPLPVHLGLALVFAGLILLVATFLRRDVDAAPTPVETSADIEVL